MDIHWSMESAYAVLRIVKSASFSTIPCCAINASSVLLWTKPQENVIPVAQIVLVVTLNSPSNALSAKEENMYRLLMENAISVPNTVMNATQIWPVQFSSKDS